MKKPVPVQIRIDIAPKGDFPPVPDLIKVLVDTMEMLEALDRNSSERHRRTTIWKVADAGFESPLHLGFVGAPAEPTGEDNAVQTVRAYVDGLRAIDSAEHLTEFPQYFDEPTLRSAKALVSVLKRNISFIRFSIPEAPEVLPVIATERIAINVDELIGPKFKAKGAIEGVLQTLSVRRRKSFNIYDPLTDAKITCYFLDDKMEAAKAAFDRRVAVYGEIHYNRHGRPITLDVEEIRLLRLRTELPQLRDIDIDITSGVDPTAYIRGLRDGEAILSV